MSGHGVLMSELQQLRSFEERAGFPADARSISSCMNEPAVNVITVARADLSLGSSAEALLISGDNWTLTGVGDAAEIAGAIYEQAEELELPSDALGEILADIRATSELFFEATGLQSGQGRLIAIQSALSPMQLSMLHIDTNDGKALRRVRYPYRMLIGYQNGGVRWFANENVIPRYWSELAQFGPSPEEALYDPEWCYDTPDNDIAFLRSNYPGGAAHISPPFCGPRLRFDLW